MPVCTACGEDHLGSHLVGPHGAGFPSSHIPPLGGGPGPRYGALSVPFFQACSCHRKQTRLKTLFQQNKHACERTTRWLPRDPTVYLSPGGHTCCSGKGSPGPVFRPCCTAPWKLHPTPASTPNHASQNGFWSPCNRPVRRGRGRACCPCDDQGDAPGRDSFLHPHSLVGTNKATATSQDSSVPSSAELTLLCPKALVLLEASGRRCMLVGHQSPGALGSDPRTAQLSYAVVQGTRWRDRSRQEKPPVVPAPPQLTRIPAASPCRSPA